MKQVSHLLIICIIVVSIASLIGCKTGNNATTVAEKIISLEQQSALTSKQVRYIDSLILALPKGSDVGISIYNLTKNKQVYTYKEHKLSCPASTMKLLTTITALSYPEGRLPFTTQVWYSGNISRDTLQGNIYIKGSMDPEFDDDAMNSLIAQIKSQPFKVINGQIIGDVSLKDSLYWGYGWMWDDAPYDYQPQLSPLMFHKGLVTITAMLDSVQQTITVTAKPQSDYYTIHNNCVYNSSQAGSFNVRRDYIHQSNHIYVEGNVTKKASADITISDVPQYFLQTFVQRLKTVGEKIIIGPYVSTHNPIDYNDMHLIATWSTDCQAVVTQMLKASDNLNAETMFYRLASINGSHPATADVAIQALRKQITNLGLQPDDYRIMDGSGLSRYDCLTPELEVAFLKYTYTHPDIYKMVFPSLPIAGIDGTIRGRMKGYNVHAKTGSFTGYNALAGYVTNTSGETFAFSIMNQNIFSEQKAHEFQDSICKLLCK